MVAICKRRRIASFGRSFARADMIGGAMANKLRSLRIWRVKEKDF
jgi:hypothetical protein